MKIGIDVSSIVYGVGVSNYTENLVKSLLKIDHQNQYILFASSLRQRKKLNEFKQSLKEFKNVEFKFLFLPPALLEILWNKLRLFPVDKITGPVDIFHSWDWVQPPISNPETKKISTIHDMVVYLFSSSVHPKILASQKRRLQLVKKEADLVLADSDTTKEDVVKFLEIPADKIRVVYLGVSNSFHPQDEDKVKNTLQKYKIKKPYILSVATQEPRKNIQKLIDVYNKIKENRRDLSLVLVGKYGWGENLTKTTEEEENIKVTGFIPKEDLINLYSGCRVFAYPSLYEGFGLPILEAMACGAPTITSNNSSMAEIARDAAILVDPRSETQITKAVEMVLDLKLEDYQKMVNASLNRARQYSWAKTAKQTLEIYREVVGQQTKNYDRQEAKRKEEKVKPAAQPLKELSI